MAGELEDILTRLDALRGGIRHAQRMTTIQADALMDILQTLVSALIEEQHQEREQVD